MTTFEKESDVFQGRAYREHLNRNWDNGNKAFQNLNALLGNADGNISFNPSKVFANEAELEATLPDGESGIFITEDDGHWHYFIDGSWKDGGAFQAAALYIADLNMPGINMLSGTSNKSRTFDMTDWGATTTASNGFGLHLKPNTTYTYFMNVEKKPNANIHLDVQGMTSDNEMKYHQVEHVKSTGVCFIVFTTPSETIDHFNVNISLNQQTNSTYQITISSESLVIGKIPVPYLASPDDYAPNKALEILNNIMQTNRLMDIIYTKQTGINLFPSSKKQTENYNVDKWASLSQAQDGFTFYNFRKGFTYTYSIQVDKLPDVPMHLAVLGRKDDGTIVWNKYSENYVAKTGRYAVTFTVPDDDIDYIQMSYSFANYQTVNHTVNMGAECLVIGSTDIGYRPSYNSFTVQELANQVYAGLLPDSSGRKRNDIPFVNLLLDTSDKLETFKTKDWGEMTTSTNAKNFTEFIKGETYVYRATFGDLPPVAVALEAQGQKNGKPVWTQHARPNVPGDRALIFTVPNDDIDNIKLNVVYSQHQDSVQTVIFGGEKLCLGKFDNGYSTAPANNYLAKQEAIKLALSNVDDQHYLNMRLPVLNVLDDGSLQYEDVKKVFPFDFYHDGKKWSAYAQMKWQGNSSKLWEEKNFKFKTFEKADGSGKVKWQPEPSFYKSHHFTLKSYYGDNYKMRGVAAANILSHFIANNDTAPIELLKANHFGTIQGTPILMYIQGSFYGIMQLETKSGDNLWNMDDDSATNIDLEADNNTDGSNWKKVPEYGTDFQSNIDTDTNAASALKKLSDAVFVDDDDAFKTNLAKNVNVKSIADYFIFNNLINNIDAWSGKNINYLSYDNGDHWYLMPYDFDSSMLQNWRPGAVIGAGDQSVNYNNLLQRAFVVFKDEIKSRYRELKQLGILNISEMVDEIDRQVNKIGSDAYQMDQDRWPNNPSYVNKIKLEEIKYMFVLRKRLLDNMLDNGVDNQFYPLALREGYIRASDGKLITVVNDPNVTTELIATNGAKSFEFKSQDVAFNNASNNSHYHYWDKDKKYIGMGNAIKSGSNPIEDSNTAYVSLSINYVHLGGKPGKWREWFAQNRYSLVFE